MTVAIQKTVKGNRRAKADVPGITRPMTYEEYMSGPEEMARYDIIDGWKIYGFTERSNWQIQHDSTRK